MGCAFLTPPVPIAVTCFARYRSVSQVEILIFLVEAEIERLREENGSFRVKEIFDMKLTRDRIVFGIKGDLKNSAIVEGKLGGRADVACSGWAFEPGQGKAAEAGKESIQSQSRIVITLTKDEPTEEDIVWPYAVDSL